MGILIPTVASHNIVTEMQLLEFDNLCFYTFKKDTCLENVIFQRFNSSITNNTTIYPKVQHNLFTAKPMEAVCWIPTASA